VKILRIQGENIASLVQFDVNFRVEPLKSAGIFAITGHTGSGKSSLLDAMCLALYQKAPRLDGAQGIEIESQFGLIQQYDVRNIIRRGANTGFALVEFLARDGQEYSARWGYRAPLRKGSSPQEELSLVRLSDQQVLCNGNNKKKEFGLFILQFVGLDFSQFTRTVLLAQGRFAEFIKAQENERAALLEKLTGTEQYTKISQYIYERSSLEKQALENLEARKQMLATLDPKERESREKSYQELQKQISVLHTDIETKTSLLQSAKQWNEAELALPLVVQNQEQVQAQCTELQKELAEQQRRLEAFQQEAEILQPQIEAAVAAEKIFAQAQVVYRGHLVSQENLQKETDQTTHDLQKAELLLQEIKRKSEANQDYLKANESYSQLVSQWSQVGSQLHFCSQAKAELVKMQSAINELTASEQRFQVQIDQLNLQRAELVAVVGKNGEKVLDDGFIDEGFALALPALRKEREELQAVQVFLNLRDVGTEISLRLQVLDIQFTEQSGVLPQVKAALENAERMVQKTRIAASQNVSALRSLLRAGEPCPVCGALEHIEHSSSDAMAQLLLEHESVYQQCLAGVNEINEALLKVDQERKHLAKQLKQNQENITALGELSQSEKERAEAVEQAQRSTYFKDRLLQVSERENAFVKMANIAEQLSKLRAQGTELHARMSTLLQTQGNQKGQLDVALQNLHLLIPNENWQQQWELDPNAFLQQLGTKVKQIMVAQDALQACVSEQARAEQSLATLQPILIQRKEQLSASKILVEQSIHSLKVAEDHVRSFFAGKTWQMVRDDMSLRMNTARHDHSKKRDEESVVTAEKATLLERYNALNIAVQKARNALEPLAPESSAASVCAALEQEYDACQKSFEDAHRLSAEHKAILETDNSSLAQAGDLLKQIEAQSPIAKQWMQLNEWVGSSSGDKFKKIAQEFTLDQLLANANAQLANITKRYQLKGFGGGMHFGVLDQEQFGELRPVHTLSGGESFIVSLALALGLSEMASSEIHIESLFIDEGFGTLDSTTLQSVMTALAGLHSQGRQVGLITHVEEMKQQIPVRIEITHESQGASRVCVIG